MSFATDTLAIAETAYQTALKSRSGQLNGRRYERHEIEKLRAELKYWQNQVAVEAAKSTGASIQKPMQVVV